MAWAQIAFVTQSIALANSITGSSFTNTGAGIITAGIGLTAKFAKDRFVYPGARAAGNSVLSGGKTAAERSAEMYKKIKNGGI